MIPNVFFRRCCLWLSTDEGIKDIKRTEHTSKRSRPPLLLSEADEILKGLVGVLV